MSFYSDPKAIDLATLGNAPCDYSGNSAQVVGPWLYNGALYTVLMPSDPAGLNPADTFPLDCWKSTDNGQTWTALDHANAPITRNWQACFDGTTITCVIGTAAWGPGLPTVGNPWQMIQFDLATGLWGAAGPNTGFTNMWLASAMGARPDGSKLVVFADDTPNPQPVAGDGAFTGLLFAASWTSGGGWAAPFQIDTNIQALLTTAYWGWTTTKLIVDASGITHLIFGEVESSVGLGNNFGVYFDCYQAILANDTLGSFSTFGPMVQNQLGPFTDGQLKQFSEGNPVIVGANVVFPVTNWQAAGWFLGVWVGSPLSAPVWVFQPNIDPGSGGFSQGLASGFSWLQGPPAAFNANGITQIVYTINTADTTYISGILRSVTSPDLIAWTGIEAFNIETDADAAFQLGGNQVILTPNIINSTDAGVAVSAIDPTDTDFQRFWFQGGAVAPSYQVKVTLRGLTRRRCDPGTVQVGEIKQAPHVKRAV